MPTLTLPDPTASPDGVLVIISSLPTMTNTELTTAVQDQITANQSAYKALATAQKALYGNSVMVLMPGESNPRFLSAGELDSVTGESSAAASAATLLASVTSGNQIVIAQGPSFQMVAFTWTWTV